MGHIRANVEHYSHAEAFQTLDSTVCMWLQTPDSEPKNLILLLHFIEEGSLNVQACVEDCEESRYSRPIHQQSNGSCVRVRHSQKEKYSAG
jgi:hypothetical protein